jgi:UTP:GlnB (protein PII) uridylyltransferase
MTIGERAEDVFYLSDLSGCALTEAAQEQLAQSLQEELD